jgi:hypothetical protein
MACCTCKPIYLQLQQNAGGATSALHQPTALLGEDSTDILDPALKFVTELLAQNGGQFGMARLSGLLKRQAPGMSVGV